MTELVTECFPGLYIRFSGFVLDLYCDSKHVSPGFNLGGMTETVANLDKAVLCYQVRYKYDSIIKPTN